MEGKQDQKEKGRKKACGQWEEWGISRNRSKGRKVEEQWRQKVRKGVIGRYRGEANRRYMKQGNRGKGGQERSRQEQLGKNRESTGVDVAGGKVEEQGKYRRRRRNREKR